MDCKCDAGTHLDVDDIDDVAWLHLLRLVQLSDTVFVAGSAATWMAQRVVLSSMPSWDPSDVDIFVLHNSDAFRRIVASFVDRVFSYNPVIHVKDNIVNVGFGHAAIPVFSFVMCDAESADEVCAGFDINVCTVTLRMSDGPRGRLQMMMSRSVMSDIVQGRMRCVIRRKRGPWQYPMQRSLWRVSKYRARGFRFVSLTFEESSPHDSELDVAQFAQMALCAEI